MDTNNDLNDLKNIAETTITLIRQARHDGERRRCLKWIVALMYKEAEKETEIENSVFIITQLYRVLGYMFKRYYKDFAAYSEFWFETKRKTTNLLHQIEEYNNQGMLNNQTYLEAKNVIKESLTYQNDYEDFVTGNLMLVEIPRSKYVIVRKDQAIQHNLDCYFM